MQMVRARVKNGRLVLDEPTDRPEGEVVELVPLDDVLAGGGDYLDDEERAALHAELEGSVAEAKAGEFVDPESAQHVYDSVDEERASSSSTRSGALGGGSGPKL